MAAALVWCHGHPRRFGAVPTSADPRKKDLHLIPKCGRIPPHDPDINIFDLVQTGVSFLSRGNMRHSEVASHLFDICLPSRPCHAAGVCFSESSRQGLLGRSGAAEGGALGRVDRSGEDSEDWKDARDAWGVGS